MCLLHCPASRQLPKRDHDDSKAQKPPDTLVQPSELYHSGETARAATTLREQLDGFVFVCWFINVLPVHRWLDFPDCTCYVAVLMMLPQIHIHKCLASYCKHSNRCRSQAMPPESRLMRRMRPTQIMLLLSSLSSLSFPPFS